MLVKILDFGIAEVRASPLAGESQGLTQRGAPRYCSVQTGWASDMLVLPSFFVVMHL